MVFLVNVPFPLSVLVFPIRFVLVPCFDYLDKASNKSSALLHLDHNARFSFKDTHVRALRPCAVGDTYVIAV